MGRIDVSADLVVAELLDMGFDFSKALEALEAVGPVLNDAVEFILNGSCHNNANRKSEHTITCSKSQNFPMGEDANSLCRFKQSHITDHLASTSRGKQHISISSSKPSLKTSHSKPLDEEEPASVHGKNQLKEHVSSQIDSPSHVILKKLDPLLQKNQRFHYQKFPQFSSTDGQNSVLHWEQKAVAAVQKHFGFSSLKDFQKEAIESWLAQKDCIILAATGSGKSLCFQIPALLSGKVVVVISPLISLMHDQCLKLAKHGISACFLGSGQPDITVEQKAMNGVYSVVYVCPETVLRLIEPLKRLAENNGIALFAIDEVHCVSKWGHDFRPDYRRLSVLRENFSAAHIRSLRSDIPLMALTATATLLVREDIRKSLLMSNETKLILTSFFRPNLRFSVRHSRTSCASSYENDFTDLVKFYTSSRVNNKKEKNSFINDAEHNLKNSHISLDVSSDEDDTSESDGDHTSEPDEEGTSESDEADTPESDSYYCGHKHSRESSADEDYVHPWGDQLTVEYLEDELDIPYNVNDLDVCYAEFPEKKPPKEIEFFEPTEAPDPHELLGHGPTIIYVPTRKETIKLARYFCNSGVMAAAYHAKLPKPQLRRTHEDFHQNLIEVVVATIAFGMGIDKSNVRRVVHYGWPQSLEAYYQEAGRAGRDGKLSDCILYANFLRIPTLLPSKKDEEQTRQAYKMLSDCFRYGMNTSICRAKILVNYFAEDFDDYGCSMCDICLSGPPQKQNMADEASVFLHTLRDQHAYMGETHFGYVSHSGAIFGGSSKNELLEPNFRDVIDEIRKQNSKFVASDLLWWRGLARILEDMGLSKRRVTWFVWRSKPRR
ncbi:ATP-dependent DNA helicase Q-like SIM [Platanthera guangdongensis]|uniref:ATP-dependent DNA helicase n=1 Tax=Platanthera guangdongensis TaxID=2320717 RepID=A0ABR2M218_9ASPA